MGPGVTMKREVVFILRNGKKWLQARYIPPFLGLWKVLLVYHNIPCREGIAGILCYPCRFVYMLETRVAVDLVYLNRQKEIIWIVESLVAYKVGPYLRDAFYILVLPAETLASADIKFGEKLQW